MQNQSERSVAHPAGDATGPENTAGADASVSAAVAGAANAVTGAKTNAAAATIRSTFTTHPKLIDENLYTFEHAVRPVVCDIVIRNLMEQIKVLIVDDEPLIRHALSTILSTDDEIVSVGSVDDGLKAVEFCRTNPVDVVLMDLQMPFMDGVEATRNIKLLPSSPAVLAITAFSSDDYLVPVLVAGASGYLVKDSEPAEIISAIRSVHRGTAAISASVSSDLVNAVQSAYQDTSVRTAGLIEDLGLTERELEILQLLSLGLNNTEISQKLKITGTTVKTHMAKIFNKLEVRDRVQALIAATRLGLIDLSKDSPGFK